MKKALAIANLIALSVCVGLAQTTPPAFDVASIKPSDPSAGSSMQIDISPGGVFTANNITLKSLIQQAFEVRDFQISGGPGWLSTQRYDIQAKGPGTGVTENEIRKMTSDQRRALEIKLLQKLRTLLADRFQLNVHQETKELPVYGLVVARSGAKVRVALDDGKPGGSLSMKRGDVGKTDVTGSKLPLTSLANLLSGQVDRTVLDQTGLTGDYDFKLTFAPYLAQRPQEGDSPGGGVDGPSLFTALQEQLGLRLDAQKGPVEVVVIDSVQKASDN